MSDLLVLAVARDEWRERDAQKPRRRFDPRHLFRGGLAFKAHRLCVSLNSRLEINKEEEADRSGAPMSIRPPSPVGLQESASLVFFLGHNEGDAQEPRHPSPVGRMVVHEHRQDTLMRGKTPCKTRCKAKHAQEPRRRPDTRHLSRSGFGFGFVPGSRTPVGFGVRVCFRSGFRDAQESLC